MKEIKKSFSGIQVLKGVNIEVDKGEIVALLGENGAGKSTLMKILAGVYEPNGGAIFLNGREVTIENPRHSQDLKISIIHQEFNLIPDLTVMENIFLGRESKKYSGVIDWKAMGIKTKKLLEKVGLQHIPPETLVVDCSVAERQLIEISKALSFESKLLIMDEPTATLNNEETDTLLQLMASLRRDGLGIIFITHRLEEVMKVADRIVVLRDGDYIGTEKVSEVTKDRMVTMMVGRDIEDLFPSRSKPSDDVVLKVENLTVSNKLHDISFEVKGGEVLGVAGLLGSGKTDLSKALFGIYNIQHGQVTMLGEEIRTPKQAIDAGIGLVTDDRKGEGLILDLPVYENLLLPFYRKISNTGILKKAKMDEIVKKWINDLKIKVHAPGVESGKLSGGNQQKVVLGKWLQMNPKLLILNEPTRGIDIGAKTEVYKIIKDLTDQGISIILISSEMPELLGMAHRIAVMHEGKISGEMKVEEATQEKIFYFATGGETNAGGN
ncbi:sugar ABC transporter ATP-binding protein [Bacillus tamaricis]|uniref:Sugar ABC transporter ATP-binding protein n=2 Tax=Evansella tamaricis TaxID=2069301 RepID=A0ABS6J9P5_9BACI|nr:sugar ABC transporter ATP-binding protein [Evansella tamaricis]MBU9710398.1 sugar ABC transporter ATP-binding protein [Evansella tamaricis]